MSLFEKLMVNLGLAEPPPAPVNLGNPNTQVWVDVHTALYYCSDSELYGKTADGKFTSREGCPTGPVRAREPESLPVNFIGVRGLLFHIFAFSTLRINNFQTKFDV